MARYFLAFVVCSLFSSSFAGFNVATDWVDIHTQIYGATGAFPLAYFLRAEAIVDNAMFDAISAYTPALTPTVGRTEIPHQRGGSPSTREQNRIVALSYAAYRVIQNIYSDYPNELAAIIDPFFDSLGLDKNYIGENLSNPAGVGNKVARLLLQARRNDGANQYADEPGTPIGGGPYSDQSNYVPVNYPQEQPSRTECSELRSINHWQPLKVNLGLNFNVVQNFEGANFGLVKPFALSSGLDFIPAGPPLFGSNTHDEAVRETEYVLNISATLDDYKKIAGEYWGLRHYSLISTQLCEERNLNLIDSVKLIFLHGMVELDGAISAWAIKRLYDSYRPISAIQCLYANQSIKAWAGRYQGVQTISGETWDAYPLYDIITPLWRTPGFPEYISGHAASAGAVFEAYRRFFGSDTWGSSVTIPEGASMVEPKITSGPNHIPGVTDVPNSGPESIGYSPAQPVTLSWPTFSSAAREIAYSRVYLGIHFLPGCMDALDVGAAVAEKVFNKYSTYVRD